ncbi:MAG: heme exporter protein CcmB [Bradymonadaceae bacterium]
MDAFLRQTAAVLRKDLRRELRTREVLTTTVAFCVLLIVVFAFAFLRGNQSIAAVYPGILWVSVLFSATLVFTRTFAHESREGCLRALTLVPGAPTALYAAKLAANTLFCLVFEAIFLPLLSLAFGVTFDATLLGVAGILAVGTVGLAALGTMTGAMLVRNRLRDVLLPVVLYPLAVPVLIAGVEATRTRLAGGTAAAPGGIGWFQLLLACDVVFVTCGYLLFRWILTPGSYE